MMLGMGSGSIFGVHADQKFSSQIYPFVPIIGNVLLSQYFLLFN
jgi:hypothetical protein